MGRYGDAASHSRVLTNGTVSSPEPKRSSFGTCPCIRRTRDRRREVSGWEKVLEGRAWRWLQQLW